MARTDYYNDPHVLAFSNGEVRKEFSLCFACSLVDGTISMSDESFEVAFISPQEIERLNMQPSIRLRIKHYLEHRQKPYIG